MKQFAVPESVKKSTGCLCCPYVFTYCKRYVEIGRCSSKIARAIPVFKNVENTKSAPHWVKKIGEFLPKIQKKSCPMYLCLLAFLNERCSPEVTALRIDMNALRIFTASSNSVATCFGMLPKKRMTPCYIAASPKKGCFSWMFSWMKI